MKRTFYSKTFFAAALLFVTVLGSRGQDDPSDKLAGTWTKEFNERKVTFTIAADHTYQTEFAGDEKIDVWGSYVISGTLVTFTDEGGIYRADLPGAYEFQVSETSVTFTAVTDSVVGRRLVMEGSWSRENKP
jgi:hypothetical protein